MSVRTPALPFESRSIRLGLLAGDTGSSRLVYAMVFALIVIGVVLIVLAVVVFRRTRVDPSVLAPLERMGSRKWRKSDEESRRALLDAVRPAGAVGPTRGELEAAPSTLPPPVVETAGESPHEATFVAGPEGVEPLDGVEPVEAVEPVEGVEAVDAGAATVPGETIESSGATESETAPEDSAEDAAPAEVVPAEVVPAEEPAGADDPVAASDEVVLSDDAVASDQAADDAVASDDAGPPGDVAAAPEVAADDEGTSAHESVGSRVEAVDDSVAGK